MQIEGQSPYLKKIMKRQWLVLLVVLLLIFLCYSNVIHGEFQFDDGYIVSEDGKFLKDPFKMLNRGLRALLVSGTRLLPAFTFYFNYQTGGSSVEGYHLTNIVFHLSTVLMVYLFVRKTLSMASIREYFSNRRDLIALSVAALWGVHPLQTEAVSYIVQRSEIMASFFYLLGLLVLQKGLESKGPKAIVYWFGALLVFLCGWLSKVIIVTMPAAFLLYVAFFDERAKFKKAVLMVLPFFVIGILFGLKMVFGLKPISNVGFHLKEIGQPEYFFTELRVILTYLRLVFVPVNQNLDYDYPIYHSITNINVLGSALFELVLVGGAFYCLGKKAPVLKASGFGILWFFLVLMPTSSVVPIKDVIFEHRAYLASMGVVFSAVVIGVKILEGKKWAPLMPLFIFLILGLATYQRNFVWQTKLSLWQDVVKKSPNKSRAHNNLGSCYYELGQDLKALYHFKKAVELDPENLEAYYNVGLALEAIGRRSEAVYYYMMFIQKSQGRYPKLLKQLKKKFFSGKYGLP